MKNSSRSAAAAKIRVLVIDDDADFSQTMIDSLRDEGITAWAVRPTPSAPAETVVASAALFQPHVILIDIVMPVNTAKLVKLLRNSPDLTNVILLGCSGHAALAENLMQHLDGFLHKPFTREELVDALLEAEELRAPAPLSPNPPKKAKRKHAAKGRHARR